MPTTKNQARELLALKRVRESGVKAPTEVILSWIRSVRFETILDSSDAEIREAAGAF